VATNPLQIRLDYGKMWIFFIGCQMEVQLATKFYQRGAKPLPTLHFHLSF